MTTASSGVERIRVVFLGNDPWSVPSLRGIAEAPAVDLALVVTNPPRPAGRGARLRPTAVADAARGLGAALAELESLRDPAVAARLRALAPDVFVVVAYGELLRPDVLAVPRLGSVNVHLSLLPRWRGASPVQHAILGGDETTGVTLISMDEGLDTGPILAQAELGIDAEEDAGTLGARLAALGASMLPSTLVDLAAGRLRSTAQSGPATMAPKLGPEARRVEWERPSAEIVRRVRAFAPDPGATTTWRERGFKILRARTVDGDWIPPGAVLAIDADGVVVGTASGAVRLLEVAPAGRHRMPAEAWARGARPEPGERFA